MTHSPRFADPVRKYKDCLNNLMITQRALTFPVIEAYSFFSACRVKKRPLPLLHAKSNYDMLAFAKIRPRSPALSNDDMLALLKYVPSHPPCRTMTCLLLSKSVPAQPRCRTMTCFAVVKIPGVCVLQPHEIAAGGCVDPVLPCFEQHDGGAFPSR